MAKADFSTPRPVKIAIMIVILLLHVVVILGLIRAFAPDLTATVVRSVTSAFTVTVTSPTPTPPPPPPPPPSKQERPREQEGAAAPPGKKAAPREVTAPKPAIVLPQITAPQVAATGNDNRSGARDSGDGTGAAGQGTGTGAGGSGSGAGGGGGGGAPVQKIRGDINSARDYPRSGADLRLGDHVIIVLTVGADGRPKACRVSRPGKDPQAGPVTCDLAMKRFRFRPATDADGKPVESVYGWQQRWFLKGGD